MFKDADMIQIRKLNKDELIEFCSHWDSGVFVSDNEGNKVEYASWQSLPVLSTAQEKDYRKRRLSDGWSVLDHRKKDVCFIYDEKEVCRAHGSTVQINTLLLNAARTKAALKKVASKDYGLVMAGGGAKGAFEIGVWKWLAENGFVDKITGIAGTSVGALNSILFVQSNYEEAKTIWESIRQNDMTYFKEGEFVNNIWTKVKEGKITPAEYEKYLGILTNAVKMMPGLGIKQIPTVLIAKLIVRFSEPVFTQEKLEEIAGSMLEKEFIADKAVFVTTARISLNAHKVKPSEAFYQPLFDGDYYCLNGLDSSDQTNLVLASACLPFVYPGRPFGGFSYCDGGCRDNLPIYPLKKAGFKKLIVIHLSNRKTGDPYVERKGDTELFHVYPAVSTKGLDKTISINQEKTDEWIADGYQCAREQLGPFLKEGELCIFDNKILEERAMKKFNYEDFDYEKVFKEIEEEIQKPNILVCGATGVGKSSLIKDYFDMEGSNAPEIGNDGRAKTTSVHRYSPENSTVVLYDSAGYVFGESAKNYSRDIIGTIEDRKKSDPGDISNHIHEVWYCVSAANKRFYTADKDLIQTITEKFNVPVMVVLTKVDLVDEKDIEDMRSVIHDFMEDLPVFTYSIAEELKEDEEIYKKYVQKDEITEWALDNLNDALRRGFLPAVKGSIEKKRNEILLKVIPQYAGLASAAATGMSFVNVPFSDSVPLMGIQLRMAGVILKEYGIDVATQEIVTDLVGTSFMTYVGRTLATQLLGVLPVAGKFIKAAVNTGVAGSVTAVFGAAMTVICEQYLQACVKVNGAKNLPFADFLTAERLKEAMQFVVANPSAFMINSFIEDKSKKGKE